MAVGPRKAGFFRSKDSDEYEEAPCILARCSSILRTKFGQLEFGQLDLDARVKENADQIMKLAIEVEEELRLASQPRTTE